MRASNEKAQRANVGLNLQTVNEANDSTMRGEIEAARLQYFAPRIHALGDRALFELFSELITDANLTCGDVTGIWSAPG